ncbi:MAG: hypothetical protein AAF765_06460 [Bacteroidota bacterium]
MSQKSIFACTVFLFCFFASVYANRCDNLYAKVTYSLGHSKKAMSATNFEHQMYYAERAMLALEKSMEYQAECACAKSENKTLDAIVILKKAIKPYDWEAGRFYTKKSMALIQELITILDECTQNDVPSVIVEDSNTATLENEAYADHAEEKVSTSNDGLSEVFEEHAQVRLDSAKKAIEKLVLLSKTYNPYGQDNSSGNLVARQKAYLEEAKKILEEGLEALNNRP